VTGRPLGHSSSTAGRYGMVGSHLIEIRALHKWLESMNLEDLLVRKNTSNGQETHKVTNGWKESRESKSNRRTLEFNLLPKT